MQTYRIRSGCAFVQPNGTRLSGGDTIDLEDDVAAQHADKIEPLSDDDAIAESPEA